MTAETLLSLIRSWRDGDCPPEVLLDAISEYGVDVDAYRNNDGYRGYDTIRMHIIGSSGFDSCSRNKVTRRECMPIRSLEHKLITGK